MLFLFSRVFSGERPVFDTCSDGVNTRSEVRMRFKEAKRAAEALPSDFDGLACLVVEAADETDAQRKFDKVAPMLHGIRNKGCVFLTDL